MKIFKQAVKKIESIVRSFLLLSVMFLAVGVVYGTSYNASTWNQFSSAYAQSGNNVINVQSTITFNANGLSGDSPSWTSLTINGIDGIKTLNANNGRGFYVYYPSNQLTLKDIRYEKGRKNDDPRYANGPTYGGAAEVREGGRLLLSGNIVFSDNEIRNPQGSGAYGGAIGLNNGSLLTADNARVSFIENKAETGSRNNSPSGGAIYVDNRSYASFVHSTVTFKNNSSDFSGAALGIDRGSSVTFRNSTVDFIQNRNGAIEMERSTIVFTNSFVNFIDNQSYGSGNFGAIYIRNNARLIMEGGFVNFSNNYSRLIGGAIWMESDADFTADFRNVEIENAHFTGNTADRLGGAIFILGNNNSTFDFVIKAVNRDVIFSNNKAGGLANDIFMTNGARILFDAASRNIELQGGIIADVASIYDGAPPLGPVNITKQGGGSLYLSGRNQLRGTLDIQVGGVYIASGELFDVSLTSLSVSQSASYSTNDDKTGQTTNAEEAYLYGSLSLDVDFTGAGASDKISATKVYFGANTYIAINNVWGYDLDGSSIAVVTSVNNISGAPTNNWVSYDDLFNAKYAVGIQGGNKLVVYLKPATGVDNAGAIIGANDGAFLKFTKDIPLGNVASIPIDNKRIVINGKGLSLKGENVTGKTGFDIKNGAQVEIIDLNFSGFKGNGAAIKVSGSNYSYANIVATKKDIVFSDNDTDLKLEDNAYVSVSGNKNVIFNGRVDGGANTTFSKNGNGTVEFRDTANLGTLDIRQGYVKQASVQVSTVGNLTVRGGSLEFGNGSYINVTTRLDMYSLFLESWLSVSDDIAVGQKKGVIKVNDADVYIDGLNDSVDGSTVTTKSSDGRYETKLWVYQRPLPTEGISFNGGNAGAAPFERGIWVEVADRWIINLGGSPVGGISLSDTFIANALRENAKANTGAIYSNFDKTVWASVNFDGASVSDDENFGASGFGGQAGYKFYDASDLKAGVFAGFGSKNFKQGTDEGSMSEFGFGVYGGYFTPTFGLKGFAGLGIQSNELKNGGTKAEFDSTAIRFGAEAEFGAGLIKPFAGFEAGLVSNPDIDVKVDGQTAATIDANSFMRFALLGGVKIANKQDKLSYFGKGYLGFLLAGGKPEYNSSVKISDTHSVSNTIDGSEQQAVYLGLGAGIDYAISNAVSLFANIDTKVNADIFDYQGNVGASFKF